MRISDWSSDVCSSDLLVAVGVAEAADQFWKQTSERHEQRRHDIERPLLAPDALYLPPDALRERLNAGERIEVCGPQHPRHAQAAALGDQPAPELPLVVKDAQPAAALKSFLASYPGRVLVAADSAGRREALLEVLQAADLRPLVLPDFQALLKDRHPREGGDPVTLDADDRAQATSMHSRPRGNDEEARFEIGRASCRERVCQYE